MSSTPITLNIPDELLAHFEQAAQHNQRSIEDIVVETLLLYPPVTPANISEWIRGLGDYTDNQLWALVRLQPDIRQENRRIELMQKGANAALSSDEAAELEQILGEMEKFVLLRSKAIRLLKERGFDMSYFLHP